MRAPKLRAAIGIARAVILAWASLWLAANSALAQIELPAANLSEQIVVAADSASRWTEGAYEVYLLRGNCYVNQGLTYARSREAVVWIERGGVGGEPPHKAIVYLEGGVEINYQQAGADGKASGAATLTDKTWFGRFFSVRPIDVRPARLEAAARRGIPAVIAPGCLDMVNFHAPETVPARFAGRTFYKHNPQVTLMRTNTEECAQLGRILAGKVNLSTGPVTVLLPKKAISVISAAGQPFYDAAADTALFDSLKAGLRRDIPVQELDCAINDPAFAAACAKTLLASIRLP